MFFFVVRPLLAEISYYSKEKAHPLNFLIFWKLITRTLACLFRDVVGRIEKESRSHYFLFIHQDCSQFGCDVPLSSELCCLRQINWSIITAVLWKPHMFSELTILWRPWKKSTKLKDKVVEIQTAGLYFFS